MSVFDGTTKVARAVPDPQTDKMLPPAGALSWGAMTSPAGLSGTNGADTKLVHGDQWDEVTGSMTENFAGNVKTQILQNESHRVVSNQELHTIGNVMQTTIGNLSTTVMSSESSARLGPVNRLFVSPRLSTWAAPDQIQKSGGTEYESKDMDLENVGFEQKNVGFSAETFLFHMEMVYNTLLTLAKFSFNYSMLEGSNSIAKLHSDAVQAEVEGARGEVRGVRGDAAAGQASAANRVNALPDVGVLTPMR